MNPLDILRTIGGKMGGGSRYPEITQFLNGPQRNAWIETGPYKAYLRKSVGGGQLPETTKGRVDLANIERTDGEGSPYELPPGERGPRGDFSGFMAELERAAVEAGYDQVYVENIFNEFLPGVLERLGYVRDPGANSALGIDADAIPSMLKDLR